jgi:hypothetical protein
VAHWAETAIFWHVYPLGFVGAPSSATDAEAAPRLRQLNSWLDYMIDLGANGLLLGPVFASETHGYDTVTHYRVDPRLGAEERIGRFLDVADCFGVFVALWHASILGFLILFDKINPESAIKAQKGLGGGLHERRPNALQF